jgi:hypothetical protein
MNSNAIHVDITATDGIVAGVPRRMLRVEAAVLAAGAFIAFTTTHEAWWLIPLAILLPDLSAIGFVAGNRAGAHLYNAAHTTPVPAILVAVGWWQHAPLAIALGLIWIAHIGIDRTLAYGLKYTDNPQHTHLSAAKVRTRRHGSRSRAEDRRSTSPSA